MIKNSYLVFLILLCSMLAQFSMQLGTDWFQYSRSDIEAGQWWRFFTGNFIHLNWRHFAMNAVGLIVIYALFPKILRPNTFLLAVVLCSLAVTLGLWLFSPLVYWYVGLSGALHGVVVTLLILDYVRSRSLMTVALVLLVLAKLVWEFTMGPLPGSESTAGGPVVVIAHLYGALGGLLFTMCLLWISSNKNN